MFIPCFSRWCVFACFSRAASGGKGNSDFVAHLKKDFVEVVGPFG